VILLDTSFLYSLTSAGFLGSCICEFLYFFFFGVENHFCMVTYFLIRSGVGDFFCYVKYTHDAIENLCFLRRKTKEVYFSNLDCHGVI